MEFAKVAELAPPDDGVHRDSAGVERHRRDGRPKIYPEGGGKGEYYTRVSTLVDMLSDKSTLNDWKLRQVLKGLGRRPDLMEDYLKIGDPDGHDKWKALKVAERAMDAADAGFRASAGTEVHNALEAHLKGQQWTLPPDIAPDVTAFSKAFERLDLHFLDSEVFSVHDDLKAAGSCDYILWYQGEAVLGDTKTGAAYYGKTAMQIAVYANSERYNPKTYERSPLLKGTDAYEVEDILDYSGKVVRSWHCKPSLKEGLFIHVPLGSGTCEIKTLDLVQGYEDARLAAQVREARRRHARKSAIPDTLVHVSADGVDIVA